MISLKRVVAALVAEIRHKAYNKLSNGVDYSRNNFNIPFLFLPKKICKYSSRKAKIKFLSTDHVIPFRESCLKISYISESNWNKMCISLNVFT